MLVQLLRCSRTPALSCMDPTNSRSAYESLPMSVWVDSTALCRHVSCRPPSFTCLHALQL